MKILKPKSYLKETLFGKEEIVQVSSFTKPDQVYEINIKEKTCTCWQFRKSKDKAPCKHLRLVLGNKVGKGFSASILKSNLQKAVRRGDYKRALISAKAHMHQAPNDFFRRLPIIVIEEAILHPDFMKLVELSGISARKSFELTKEIENLALRIVEQISKCEVRDCGFISYNDGYKSINIIPLVDLDELPKAEQELVKAIKLRERQWGMPLDRSMLANQARIWAYRFKEKIFSIRKLKHIYNRIETSQDYSHVKTELTENDILLESIDRHDSPLINILENKNWVISLVGKFYPDDVMTVGERIWDIIWRKRSGVNFKIDIFTNKPIDWFAPEFNNATGADSEKYEAIFQALEAEIKNICIWFINKSK